MFQFKCSELFCSSMITLLIGVSIMVSSMDKIKAEVNLPLLQSPEKIKSLLESGKLNQETIPNPHWKKDACAACHTGQSGFNRSDLRTVDAEVLCGNCHNEYSKEVFQHPTGQEISETVWRRLPEVFRKTIVSGIGAQAGKTISCLTCHDMTIQCLESRMPERSINHLFFRAGPYRDRVDLCFYCHSANQFERFSPHEQVVNNKIDKRTCKVCHLNTDKLTPKTKHEDIKLQSSDDLTKLCVNCHPWRPHPGGEITFGKKKKDKNNHLVIPSKEMLQRMASMQKKTGVLLPLNPTDEKINCATCHNPHQKGVIKSKAAMAGADSKQRLRLAKSCSYCHDV